MKNFICCKEVDIPQEIPENTYYFALYPSRAICRDSVGYININFLKKIKNLGIFPQTNELDFTTIALSVAAIDNAVSRQKSVDGWTRNIHTEIALCDPAPWNLQRDFLQKAFHFLTGDYWQFEFKAEGWAPIDRPDDASAPTVDADCVCLLSGGLDSFVGAIDLQAQHKKPLFVSQITRADAPIQRELAELLNASERHIQLGFSIKSPCGETEKSTRARSIVFFSYALLATSLIRHHHKGPIDIIVPENGFISLNIPMNSGRIGSFSTKTTHPIYLKFVQKIWDNVQIPSRLNMPYQFKTKGEMLIDCRNRALLKQGAYLTASCGKYSHYGRKHCGRCLPCLVRRAAFAKARLADRTINDYVFADLSNPDANKKTGANDFHAIAEACITVQRRGIQRFLAGELAFAPKGEKAQYSDVVSRGLKELKSYLHSWGVI